ncbi:MAG: hypothetical protein RL189_1734 [Pseudomonadota bacterium]
MEQYVGMTNLCQFVFIRLRRSSVLALMILLSFPNFGLAAKKEEALKTAPDSHTAGLVNTEVVPEGAYQADFVTGHLWYGTSEKTNIFTNVYAGSITIVGIPTLTLGGKTRYCEGLMVSCSLLAEVGVGVKPYGTRYRHFAGLLQNSVAVDFDTSGRMTIGTGVFFYAYRESTLGLTGFEDRSVSWMNFIYDYQLGTDWSLGAGYSPVLKSLEQYHVGESLYVNRLGLLGGGLFHARVQYSTEDWQFSGGGALLAAGGNWSLWPVLEVIWRKPESLLSPADTQTTEQGKQESNE